jgi:hypothetical protein
MLGVLLTNAIIIYQTRDSKGDVNKLAHAEQLKNRLEWISAHLQTALKNVTTT